MRVIYRKIRLERYLYIKRNVEKDGGARYTLGARYLSKNTVFDTVLQRGQLTKVFPFMKSRSLRKVRQSTANKY